MLRKDALNFDQRKTFPKNYKPIIVSLCGLFTKLPTIATFRRVHSNSKEVFHLPWQCRYSHLKMTYHNKPKFFLRIKLLRNLLTPCKISNICHWGYKKNMISTCYNNFCLRTKTLPNSFIFYKFPVCFTCCK